MSENMKLLRFYFWLLAVFTVGRWALGFAGAPYEKTHQVFSIVTMALIASAHHAAFARAFAGYTFARALTLGATIGLLSQVVIFVSTALSYLLGLETFFNAPRALNVEQPIGMAQALGARAFGVLVNTILNTIAAAIGFGMGGALPKSQAR